MQISEVMHSGFEKVNIGETIRRVSELMRDHDIGAVPVFKDDEPVGFVTDRDLVISGIAEGLSLEEPVSRTMSDSVICIESDKDVREASRLMQDRQVSRLLVLGDDRKPVGILSLQDIAQTGFDELESETLTGIKES